MKKLVKSKDYINRKDQTSDIKIDKHTTTTRDLDYEELEDEDGNSLIYKNGRISSEAGSGIGLLSSLDYDESFDESSKLNVNYLTSKVDSIINDLYSPNQQAVRLFQYYHGVRTDSKFSELVAKDGLSNPLDMDFLSIIKPRINVLLGVQKDHTMQYTVQCTGNDLYYKEEEEEKQKLLNTIFNKVREENIRTINKFNKNGFSHIDYYDSKQLQMDKKTYLEATKSKPTHNNRTSLEEELQEIILSYKKTFKSTIQQQSDLVLKLIQDKNRFANKVLTWLKYLLICGRMYGRANFANKGEIPTIEVLHPLFVFHPALEEGQPVSDCPQAYHMRRLSKIEILNRYGHLMTKDQRQEFISCNYSSRWISSDTTWDPQVMHTLYPDTVEHMYDTSSIYYKDYNNINESKLYCNVYEVEWIEMVEKEINGKTVLIQELYQAIRIGGPGGFYLDMGPSDKAVRDIDNPLKTKLTIEGMTIADSNLYNSTLVGSIMPTQDKYDYINLLRENLIHNAHVGGITIDLNVIPTYLGATIPERIDKWMDNIRAGFNIVNPLQDGMKMDPSGHYATKSFDSNLNPNLIQALDMVLDRYEQNAGDITGINRQMLGQFQERDGAAVTKQALSMASLQSKEWYSLLDTFVEIILTSALNMSRISLSEGQALSYTLGNKSALFTINKHFNIVNYNVKVVDYMKESIKLERLRSFVTPLIESAGLSKEEVLEITVAETAQQAYSRLQDIISEQKVNKLSQSQAEVEQLQAQLEELSKEIEKYKKMELDIKLMEQQRKERELMQSSISDLEKRKLEERKLNVKDEAYRRREEIELEEARAGGRDVEVKNVEM